MHFSLKKKYFFLILGSYIFPRVKNLKGIFFFQLQESFLSETSERVKNSSMAFAVAMKQAWIKRSILNSPKDIKISMHLFSFICCYFFFPLEFSPHQPFLMLGAIRNVNRKTKRKVFHKRKKLLQKEIIRLRKVVYLKTLL